MCKHGLASIPLTKPTWALVSDLNLLSLLQGNPIILRKVISAPILSNLFSLVPGRDIQGQLLHLHTHSAFPASKRPGSSTRREQVGEDFSCQRKQRAHTLDPWSTGAAENLGRQTALCCIASSAHKLLFSAHCAKGRFQKFPCSTKYACLVGSELKVNGIELIFVSTSCVTQ